VPRPNPKKKKDLQKEIRQQFTHRFFRFDSVPHLFPLPQGEDEGEGRGFMQPPRLDLRPALFPTLNPKLVQKLMGRLKLADFMELPEDKYQELIKVTSNATRSFRSSATPATGEEKVLGFQRYAFTDLSKNCCEFKEEITAKEPSPEIESPGGGPAGGHPAHPRHGRGKIQAVFPFQRRAAPLGIYRRRLRHQRRGRRPVSLISSIPSMSIRNFMPRPTRRSRSAW